MTSEKYVKITNPRYEHLSYEIKSNKHLDNNTVSGTCLVWEYVELNEIKKHYTQFEILTVTGLVEDLRTLSHSISFDDLCGDGKQLFYILNKYIEKELSKYVKNTEKFIALDGYGRFWLLTEYSYLNWNWDEIPSIFVD